MSDTVRNEGKADWAFCQIKDKILTLEFAPSQPLREIELSQMLGVSRTPIRSAIERLVSDHFAQEDGANRTIVSPVSVDAFMEIYELREMMEGLCVEKACFAWKSTEELDALREMLQEQDSLGRETAIDSRNFLEQDRQYHRLLAELTGSKLLTREMLWIYDLYWRYIYYTLYNNRSIQIAQEHQEILDAIEHRDARTARRCMQEHLSKVKDEVLIGLAKGFNPVQELRNVSRGYSLL